MPVFDLEEQKIYVRIVYDGTQAAGKTTNLKKLCEVFTTKRRSELYTPEELGGRTLYFDWLQIATGLANGYPLVCQVVSVPGQVVLEPRRRHLLRTADAVVYVADSAPSSVARSRESLEVLLSEERRRNHVVPLVIQANKQDLPGALGPSELLDQLGLSGRAAVFGASAQQGGGVLETFVAAVRTIVNDIQERTRTEGFRMAVMPAESAHEVYLRLAQEELDEGWVEDLLDEQWDISVDEPDMRIGVERATVMPEGDVEELRPSSAPPPAASGAMPVGSVRPPSRAPAAAAPSVPPVTVRAASLRPAPLPPPPEPATLGTPIEESALAAPLPTHDVPTGFIWPASSGRDTLRTLDRSRIFLRDDLVGAQGTADGSGKSDTILCQAGGYCLKTSERRHFTDSEAARTALVRAAREKASLSEIVVPDTVLVVQPCEDGTYWLWTVAPWLVTLRGQMTRAAEARDEEALASALSSFAKAAVDALLLAARTGIVLDVHPSNYGERDGRTFYLDDDTATGSSFPQLGYALLKRVEEYGAFPNATEAYVTALERQISQRVGPAEADKVGLAGVFEQVLVHSPTGLAARERLVRSVPVAEPALARA